MAPQHYQVRRLEQTLQVWEDLMWARELGASQMKVFGEVYSQPVDSGPLANFATLRHHLGSIKRLEDFDKDRYLPLFTPMGAVGTHELMPYFIAAWLTKSRRVYRLTEDLQLLLASISLKNVNWEDVQFPFDSFGISLPIPLMYEKLTAHDFLLVSPIDMRDGDYTENGGAFSRQKKPLAVAQLGPDLDRWKPFPLRQDADRRRKQFGVVRAWDFAARKRVRTSAPDHMFCSCFITADTGSVASQFNELQQQDRLPMGADMGWRIAINLSRWLRMKRQQDAKYVGDIERINRTDLPTLQQRKTPALTDGTELCTVTSMLKFTDYERAMLKGLMSGLSGRELGCHFREGHMRRPPGLGHIEGLEQTVNVKPTIVRLDRWDGVGPIGREAQFN